MKKSACGRHLSQPLSASSTPTLEQFANGAPNWVIVHFHYPQGLLGRLIQLYQWATGCKFHQFVHVSLELQSGERYDRTMGQTLMGFTDKPPGNGVRLLVPCRHTDEQIAASALTYLKLNGDTWFDCHRFVQHVINMPQGLSVNTPATLFRLYVPYYEYLLNCNATTRQAFTTTSNDTIGEWFNNEGDSA